ncbi:hypothetical protein QA640_24075 [Bradyrhizobium sp. CB82]|uniref:hypothetical protein n=1 Tax=Bradyrhizobium sp. CB82 TaxID=3039159 RepID=UPI0024B1FB3A|nr:hypothetical protein [Bradyrhizobium sp. CB82]WFU37554.1 hypothetical protein QA640_24075 [Bradyrhizobium sp. CB82]
MRKIKPVDVAYLKARAARGKPHVAKFVPVIPVMIDAIKATVGKDNVDHRSKNQIKVAGRWVGRFKHGNRTKKMITCLAIMDADKPVVMVRTMREAEVFAASVKWARAAIAETLSKP